jgi:small subunit ribosomal protein S11
MARGKKPTKKRSRTSKKEVEKGKVYISATFNNTLITVCDEKGNTLTWGSAGSSGFKGTRKSTPYAANTAVNTVIKKAMEDHSLKEIEIYLKGPGPGREAALRAIRGVGIKIALIADVTPIPHNGPRPKKKRRV